MRLPGASLLFPPTPSLPSHLAGPDIHSQKVQRSRIFVACARTQADEKQVPHRHRAGTARWVRDDIVKARDAR